MTRIARIIAVILIPCVLLDPALAASLCNCSLTLSSVSKLAPLQSRFSAEALAEDVQATRFPLHAHRVEGFQAFLVVAMQKSNPYSDEIRSHLREMENIRKKIEEVRGIGNDRFPDELNTWVDMWRSWTNRLDELIGAIPYGENAWLRELAQIFATWLIDSKIDLRAHLGPELDKALLQRALGELAEAFAPYREKIHHAKVPNSVGVMHFLTILTPLPSDEDFWREPTENEQKFLKTQFFNNLMLGMLQGLGNLSHLDLVSTPFHRVLDVMVEGAREKHAEQDRDGFRNGGLVAMQPPSTPDPSPAVTETAGYLALAASLHGSTYGLSERQNKVWNVYQDFRKKYSPLTSAQLTLAFAIYAEDNLMEWYYTSRSIEDMLNKLSSGFGGVSAADLGMAAIAGVTEYPYDLKRQPFTGHWLGMQKEFQYQDAEARPFLCWAASFKNAERNEAWSVYNELVKEFKFPPKVAALITAAAMRHKPEKRRSSYSSSSSSSRDPVSAGLGALVSILSIFNTLDEMNRPSSYRHRDAREHYDEMLKRELTPETAALLSIAIGPSNSSDRQQMTADHFKEFLRRAQAEAQRSSGGSGSSGSSTAYSSIFGIPLDLAPWPVSVASGAVGLVLVYFNADQFLPGIIAFGIVAAVVAAAAGYLWTRALRASDARILRPSQWRSSSLDQRVQKAFDYIDRKYPDFEELHARRPALEKYLRGNSLIAPRYLEEALAGDHSFNAGRIREIFAALRVGFIEGGLDYDTVTTLDYYLLHRIPKDYNYNAKEDGSFIQTLRGTRQLRMTSAKAQGLLDRAYHVYQDVEQGRIYKSEVDLWHGAVQTFKTQLVKSLNSQDIFVFFPEKDHGNRLWFDVGGQHKDILFSNNTIFIARRLKESHGSILEGRLGNPFTASVVDFDNRRISVHNMVPGLIIAFGSYHPRFGIRGFAVSRAGLYLKVTPEIKDEIDLFNRRAPSAIWPFHPVSIEEPSPDPTLQWVDLIPDIDRVLAGNDALRDRADRAEYYLRYPRWFSTFPQPQGGPQPAAARRPSSSDSLHRPHFIFGLPLDAVPGWLSAAVAFTGVVFSQHAFWLMGHLTIATAAGSLIAAIVLRYKNGPPETGPRIEAAA